MTIARLRMAFASAGMFAALTGCSRTSIPSPAPAPAASALRNDSYTDLKAGWTLRIVVPLLKSGAFQTEALPQKTEGNTIWLSATDFIGYTTSQYAVTGKAGKVRLTFLAAEESREGHTAPLMHAPALPFQLPRKAEYVRLVYLVRVSQADHNMAIVAATRLDALSAFTNRFMENPSVCHSDTRIFCSWVPAGVAVRAETNAPRSHHSAS